MSLFEQPYRKLEHLLKVNLILLEQMAFKYSYYDTIVFLFPLSFNEAKHSKIFELKSSDIHFSLKKLCFIFNLLRQCFSVGYLILGERKCIPTSKYKFMLIISRCKSDQDIQRRKFRICVPFNSWP